MRDSPCPMCGLLGKKRYYETGNGYVQVRWEHWNGEAQSRCYVPKEAITTKR